ncbi:MAG: cupin domain-containing protein [Chlorobium sp.]|nr:MAG: cupin domain-containing protein [Chlorobium sp.]
MHKAEFWIEQLQLLPHPEGGFYRETYRSGGAYPFEAPPFNGPRSYVTAIHYLLRGEDRSKLHQIHSDELWFFHAGDPLTVYLLPESGHFSSFTLGLEADKGQVLQETVTAATWFGACCENSSDESYALVSCVVAPGFDFRDFAFADRKILQQKFPRHTDIIERLT